MNINRRISLKFRANARNSCQQHWAQSEHCWQTKPVRCCMVAVRKRTQRVPTMLGETLTIQWIMRQLPDSSRVSSYSERHGSGRERGAHHTSRSPARLVWGRVRNNCWSIRGYNVWCACRSASSLCVPFKRTHNIVGLRVNGHETKQMLDLLVQNSFRSISNFGQQLATTSNRVFKRTQHVGSNNVASVFTGLYWYQTALLDNSVWEFCEFWHIFTRKAKKEINQNKAT